MSSEYSQRQGDVKGWWDRQFSDTLIVSGDNADNIKLVFEQVLTALSDDDYDRFDQASPRVIYRPDLAALVFQEKWYAAPGTAVGHLTFIYMAPAAAKLSRQQLRNLVAHEVAHVVLHSYDDLRRDECNDIEGQADELARQWGFDTFRCDFLTE